MLGDYANQTVSHKAKASVNSYNEPTYSTAADIKCRLEFKRKLVRDKHGQEVISEATLYTETAITPDDVITHSSIDWTVIAVEAHADLGGTVQYYEVML